MKEVPRFKIAVAGAHDTSQYGDEAFDQATNLGKLVAEHDAVLVTGATPGFSFITARAAKEAGGMTVGYSPAANIKEHREVYRFPTEYHDIIIYTGFGGAGRDIMQMRSVDAVIFGCGGIETIHEFAGAYQENKILGVLEGGWGTDELIRDIVHKTGADRDNILYDHDANRLLDQIVKRIKLTQD